MKRIRRFVESLKEGERSRLITMGGTFHASRIDEDHVFGVVELTDQQIRNLDAIELVTLLPQYSHTPISAAKNPNALILAEHLAALGEHGVLVSDTSDIVVEKMIEKFQNPLFQ